MAKFAIVVGPRGKTAGVDALPFLPGLYVHKAPDRPKSEGTYNIAHIRSGLAILTNVPENRLELARMILGRVFWDKDEKAIFDDGVYHEVILNAEAVVDVHRKRSAAQETRIAKAVGGKKQPASGSRSGYKRDVVTSRLVIEAKTTTKNSWYVDIADLDFLREQACITQKVPAYIVEMQEREEVVILPEESLPAEFFTDDYKRLRAKTKKGFSITIQMAIAAATGEVTLIETKNCDYYMVGYEQFLDLVKSAE